MAPVIVGQSASHLGTLVNTIIASFLAAGSVSYLYYADRLIEFPLGVFGVAIATAVLPTLSEQAARRDPQALRETLSFALRLATFVSVPAAVGLFVLCEPIVRVLYERGRFGPVDTAGTAAAVAMYAVGVVGLSITRVAVQGFYALGDTRTPVKVSVSAMALNCGVAAALAQTHGHVGVAFAKLGVGHRARARPRRPAAAETARPGRPGRRGGPGSNRGRVGGARSRARARRGGSGLRRPGDSPRRRGSRRSSSAPWPRTSAATPPSVRMRCVSRGARSRAAGANGGGVPCAAGRRVDILGRDRTTCGPCCSA